jgi:hypothetical protein
MLVFHGAVLLCYAPAAALHAAADKQTLQVNPLLF